MSLKIAQTIFAAAAIAVFAHASQAMAFDLKADAFGSAYYGQPLSTDLQPYGFSGTSTDPDFTHFSLIGADITAKVNDEWSAAAEIIAEGQNGTQINYTAYAEWAYVNWTPIEGLSIKVGRQRYPIWSASEYINNHFELPYRVMPQIVYQMSPFAAFDGASITETTKLADGLKGSLQVFGGTPILGTTIDSSVLGYSATRLIGARVNVEGDGWRLRAQASRYNETLTWGSGVAATVQGQPITFQELYGTNQANLTNLSAGYRFDKYNIVSWGEYGFLYSNDATVIGGTPAVHYARGGYALLGYRIDKWLPRYTFAQSSFDGKIQNGKVTTHTVGLNYNFNENVTVKADFEIDLIPTVGGGPGGLTATSPATATSTSGSAFFLGADFYI